MGAYLSSPNRDKDTEEGENNRLRFGATTMQGWRMNQEDAHNCILNFDENCSFFAVYDGHGGPEVSKYAANNFPEFLKSSEHWVNSKVETALEDSFLKFDENLLDDNVIVELKALGDIVDAEGDDDEEDKAKLMEEATLPIEQVLSRYGIQLRMKRDEFSEDILSAADENDVEKTLTNRKTKVVAEIREQNGHIESEAAENKEEQKRPLDEKNGQRASLKRDINGNTLCSLSTAVSHQTTTTSQLVNTSGDSKCCPSSPGHLLTANGSSSKADSLLAPEGKKMRLDDPIEDNSCSNNSLADKDEMNEKDEAAGCHTLQNGIADDSQDGEMKGDEPKAEKVIKSSVKFETETVEIGEKGGVMCETSEVLTCQIDSDNYKGDRSIADGQMEGANKENDGAKQQKVENGTAGRQGDDDEDEEEDDEEYEDTSDDSEEGNDDDLEADDEDDNDEENDDDDEEEDEDEAPDDFEREIARAALENMEQFPGPVEELPGNSSGTTACVVVLKDDTVYVANAGDSRCVLCRDGKALDLSVDHKPEDDIERKRIEAAGGAITEDGRVNGGLNLSRALGDHFYKSNKDIPLKDQMISPFPDVQVEKLTAEDSFLVLACDGIWNSMSSQAVVDFVDARLKAGLTPVKICEEICDSCLAETTVGDGTGCDNMTVIVVDLKRRPPPTHDTTTAAAAAAKNIRPPNTTSSTDLDPEAADRTTSPAPADPVPVV